MSVFMLSVVNKPFMANVIIPNVVMLSVGAPKKGLDRQLNGIYSLIYTPSIPPPPKNSNWIVLSIFFIFNIWSEFIYFDVLDAANPARYAAMVFSAISLVFSTPLMCILIQYESNCQNRILINRWNIFIL